MTDISHKAQHF